MQLPVALRIEDVTPQRKMTLPKTDNSLTDLFQRLSPRLMAVGRRLLGNRDEALDAMQDTFVKLWSRHSDPAEGVVITAMRNTCIDALRSQRATESIDEYQAEYPDDERERAMDLYDDVSRVIDRCLSPRDRMILIMRDRDGFEFDAIAARTGLSEPNIRLILSRARRSVRQTYLSQFRNRQ